MKAAIDARIRVRTKLTRDATTHVGDGRTNFEENLRPALVQVNRP
jgi:hypothetical protein